MDFDQPPVVRVSADLERPLRRGEWPATIPAVAQVLRDRLDLGPGVTFLARPGPCLALEALPRRPGGLLAHLAE